MTQTGTQPTKVPVALASRLRLWGFPSAACLILLMVLLQETFAVVSQHPLIAVTAGRVVGHHPLRQFQQARHVVAGRSF